MIINPGKMKKFLLAFLCMAASVAVFSQKVYFVYLQTEQEQPFYVRLNDKLYSSTASGYLILSQLRDSTYYFLVGFPGSKWPEQRFNVTISGKDHGYLVKNFGEKGWGLFNLQSMNIQMAEGDKRQGRINMEKKEVSEFTSVLSKASDDPSLLEKPVFAANVVEQPVKESIVKTEPPLEKPIVKEPVREESIQPAAIDTGKPQTETIAPGITGKEIKQGEKVKADSIAIVVKKPEQSEEQKTLSKDSLENPAAVEVVSSTVAKIGEIKSLPDPVKVTEDQKAKPAHTEEQAPGVEVVESTVARIGESTIKHPLEEKKRRDTKKEDVKKPDPGQVTKKVDGRKEERRRRETPKQEVVKEEPKAERKDEVVANPVMVEEKTIAKIGEIQPETDKPDTQKEKTKASETEQYKRSTIIKKSEAEVEGELALTFIDESPDAGRDTIRIIIPASKMKDNVVKETQGDDKKFLNISSDTSITPGLSTTSQPVKETKPQPVKETKAVAANKCKAIAGDEDFLKLRKRMVAEDDDDDMVDEARKSFKSKCYSTVQVKNLGALLLDDLGKYKFYEMAYPYVSDRENFPTLQSELKNDYYIHRFKSLLGN